MESDDHLDWVAPPLDIEKTSYSVAEFLEWDSAGRLSLSPEFQRGSVWTGPARAYLIDTILRGYPIPPVHIRLVQRANQGLIREVIDGQQRISAVLLFAAGKLRLSRPRSSSEPLPPWAGSRFQDLDPALQDRFTTYSFRCELYKGNIEEPVIYEIFSRINTYSVPLSDQELRNGKFFGEFKTAVYALAAETRPFLVSVGVFTTRQIARMVDREFVSEVLTLQMKGMQDKKASLNGVYAELDQEWENRTEHEERFRATIDALRDAVGDSLVDSQFNRPALFYSLYAVVYHRMFGIDAQRLPVGEDPLPASPLTPLNDVTVDGLRYAIGILDDALTTKESGGHGLLIEQFLAASARQTDNIRPRLARFRSLWNLAGLSRLL